MSYQERLDRLYDRLTDVRLGAMALIPGPSLFYISGLSFHLMERPVIALLSRDAEPIMVVPELERDKAESSPIEFRLFSYSEEEGAALEALYQSVAGLALEGSHIGVEPLRMRFHELDLLQVAVPRATFVSSDGAISALRIQKDPAEIAAMQRAAEIAEAALEETLSLIKVGMTELELASELTMQLLQAGSEPEFPFSPIVASGPNAALPHAVPSDRALAEGDSLILDWGAVHQGYVSDITRTFFVGKAPDELSQVHEIVQQANAAGRAAAQPGATCGGVDLAARSEIERAGYSEYFLHRTGHGIGLEAHEPPFIREGEKTVLKAGMTFTVEPGVYLRGRGGVRVEDDVAVTEEGSVSLTTLPREARIVA
ncbi:MAG: aminopeptidase P family protein [Anaerolineae bacterium]|nr:MAG: aminopeptidase P family protein [Anaerolineae bacterium]